MIFLIISDTNALGYRWMGIITSLKLVFCIFIIQFLRNLWDKRPSLNLNAHLIQCGRTFIWLYFLSLLGLPEGFITDRILLGVSVSRQCPFSLALSFDCLREKYLTIQTVKFLHKKPVIFTSSYMKQTGSGANHLHSQWILGVFLPEGKADGA
jgi:hypothetical protein